MPLYFGARVFRPTRLPTIGFLLLFPLLIALGFWQLDRAAQKRALLEPFESGDQAAVSLDRVYEIDPHAQRYAKATVSGRYDAAHQFLLDSMTHAGLAGYHVLTPLRLTGGNRAVIVDRGWVPAGATRQELPAVPIDDDMRELSGRIDLPPRPGIRLEQTPAESGGDWPQVVLYPTIETLEARLGYPLENYFLLLAPNEPDGFVREWQRNVPGPERHIAYAVQWFAMALVLLIIYIVVNLEAPDDRGPA
ncbi:MAG: SURF1 family protein [Gammaproteobacteria bacterium]